MSNSKPKKQSKITHKTITVKEDTTVNVPKVKKWTSKDLSKIEPMTSTQVKMFEAYRKEKHILAVGSPGTGKTFLAVYLGLVDVLDKSTPVNHLKIVRSAVESRPLGYLKGTAEEKVSEYEAPYIDAVAAICEDNNAYEDMKKTGIINFTSTSFVRGKTWDNTVVILDEVQNLTWHEIHSVVTRLGVNSKIIIAGDFKQCDLNQRKEKSGIDVLLRVVEGMKEFEVITFTKDDCVRSGFVKAWLHRCEDLGYI